MGRLGFAMASEHWTGRWKNDCFFFFAFGSQETWKFKNQENENERERVQKLRRKWGICNIQVESNPIHIAKVQTKIQEDTDISTWKQYLFKNNLIHKLFDIGASWETSSPIGWQSKLITPSILFTDPTSYNFILLMKILKRILVEHTSQQTRQRDALE